MSYRVERGEETHEVDTRSGAIALARELSDGTSQPVVVSDEAQCERLTYQEGDLSKYLYESPRGRR